MEDEKNIIGWKDGGYDFLFKINVGFFLNYKLILSTSYQDCPRDKWESRQWRKKWGGGSNCRRCSAGSFRRLGCRESGPGQRDRAQPTLSEQEQYHYRDY